MSTSEVAESDEYQGAKPSRPLEIAFAAAALAFTAGYLALSTQIDLRREAAPGQIDQAPLQHFIAFHRRVVQHGA